MPLGGVIALIDAPTRKPSLNETDEATFERIIRAYITEDECVKRIIGQLRLKQITIKEARKGIRAITLEEANKDKDGEIHLSGGQDANDPAFLDWEIEEALKPESEQV